MTNVNQKFEITGYTPDFKNSKLRVLAFNMDTQAENEYEVKFSDIAMAFSPEGEGKKVITTIVYNGMDETGPYSEPFELPLSPAAFIGEIFDSNPEHLLKKEDREPLIIKFDEVICGLLETPACI